MKKLLFIASVFLTGSMMAQNPLAIKGEFLYWAPVFDNYWLQTGDIAIADSVSGRRINNLINFHPAFRIDGLFTFDPAATLETRFTYFNGGHTQTVTDASALFIDTPLILAGTASSHANITYYGGDLDFQHPIYCTPFFNFTLLEGVHYANIRFKDHRRAAGTSVGPGPAGPGTAFLNYQSQFWGVGPEIGFDLRGRPFNQQFELIGNFRTSLLVGHTASNIRALATTPLVTAFTNLRNDPQWQIVPSFDSRLGFGWNQCFACFTTMLEVGYEFVWYYNSIAKGFLSASDTPVTSLGFHGPYASLGVCF